MTIHVDWPGHKGNYRYFILEVPVTNWNVKREAGNYLFARMTLGGWMPEYFGIAEDLGQRLPSHDRWAEAQHLGCTAIMAHTNAFSGDREAEEKDLIARWNPRLNTQHKSPLAEVFEKMNRNALTDSPLAGLNAFASRNKLTG